MAIWKKIKNSAWPEVDYRLGWYKGFLCQIINCGLAISRCTVHFCDLSVAILENMPPYLNLKDLQPQQSDIVQNISAIAAILKTLVHLYPKVGPRLIINGINIIRAKFHACITNQLPNYPVNFLPAIMNHISSLSGMSFYTYTQVTWCWLFQKRTENHGFHK